MSEPPTSLEVSQELIRFPSLDAIRMQLQQAGGTPQVSELMTDETDILGVVFVGLVKDSEYLVTAEVKSWRRYLSHGTRAIPAILTSRAPKYILLVYSTEIGSAYLIATGDTLPLQRPSH